MKHLLYIGQYSPGTTSRMRCETLSHLLGDTWKVQVIDTHIPFFATNRIFRSLGFRFKIGPLISKTNRTIIEGIEQEYYDLIWVDKAIFLQNQTTAVLRGKTPRLVHFTPDPAFTYHKSRLFYASIRYYDHLITTKRYEIPYYHSFTDRNKVIYCTQGFDPNLHFPRTEIEDKSKGVIFIGHFEKNRAVLVRSLLQNEIHVAIAGIKWERFVSDHYENPYLTYLGTGLYGEDYAKTLGKYWFGLGVVSKWVPELHTTRTFEIPACGTILLTERNIETSSFFEEDEVIFYSSPDELIQLIKKHQGNLNTLTRRARKGFQKVANGGYDYRSILSGLLGKVLLGN